MGGVSISPQSLILVIGVLCGVYGTWLIIGLALVLPQNLEQRVALDLGSRVVLPCLALFALYKFCALRLEDYWIKSPFKNQGVPEVLAVTILSTLLLLTYVIVANLVSAGGAGPVQGIEQSGDFGTAYAAIVIVYLAATASVTEEVFYRALPRLLFRADASWPRLVSFLLVSSVFFGFMHAPYGTDAIVPAAYFGLIASLILMYTNNLWFVVAAHFLSDVIIMWWRFIKYGVLSL